MNKLLAFLFFSMILVVNAKSPDIVPSGDLSVTKTQKNKNK